MKQIPLSQGQFALVDDQDYDYLMQWKWYALYCKPGKTFYARRNVYKNGKWIAAISMHRLLIGLMICKKTQVDHIDHNGLNNCRSNIRLATAAQNIANRASRHNSTSKFVGVCWHKKTNKWQATIKKNFKVSYLGIFNNEQDAAKAYDEAAIKIHGEFANLNFKNT